MRDSFGARKKNLLKNTVLAIAVLAATTSVTAQGSPLLEEPDLKYNNAEHVRSVASDSSGHVYTGSSTGSLKKINISSGQVEWSYKHGDEIDGIALDSNGKVYTASDDGNVRKIDSSGDIVWKLENGNGFGFNDVVVGDQHLYAVSSTTRKIDLDGNEIWSIDNAANGVALDKEGNIYTANGGGKTVKKINSDGNILWSFEKHTDSVLDVDVHQGAVYSIL